MPQDYNTVLRRLAADGNWVVAPVQPQYVPMDPVLKLLGGSREKLQVMCPQQGVPCQGCHVRLERAP